jgi:asparagine synthase (glutamine-hydrolysing)
VRDCAAELRDRLADAVRQRLPESGALLSELSGGLDSTSITMLAGRFFAEEPGRLHAVTVGNSEAPSSDESGLAAIVAKAAGARHYVLEWGSSKPLFEGMPENAYFWDEPRFNVNSHAFAVAKSQLMNSIGARNVFSGAGAEVVLCAQMMWPVFLADALIWGRWAELGRGLGWWRESSRMPWSVLLYRSCIAPLLLPRSAMTAEGKNIEPPWLTTRARKRAKQLSAHHPPPLVDRLNSGGAWMAEQWQGAASAADQGYGEFAYHTSFPFLDRPLVESVLRMPWNARVHPRTNKPLLRTVARELLPEGFAMRWSIRADQSVGRRLSRQREWIKKLIAPSVLVDLGIVEGKTLRETLSAHEEGFGRGLRFTVTILAVELWAQSVRSGDWWEKRRRLLRHLVPSYSHSKPSTAHGGTGDSVSDMRRTSVHLHDALPLTSDPL